MAIVKQTVITCALVTTFVCTFALPQDARAAVSQVHQRYIDFDDWLEQRGFNPEREMAIGIGNWNRREIQGYWPEVEYSYYEWLEVSEHYEDEDDPE